MQGMIRDGGGLHTEPAMWTLISGKLYLGLVK
jgi:hypothetical protein